MKNTIPAIALCCLTIGARSETYTVTVPSLDLVFRNVIEYPKEHSQNCRLVRYVQDGKTNEFHAWMVPIVVGTNKTPFQKLNFGPPASAMDTWTRTAPTDGGITLSNTTASANGPQAEVDKLTFRKDWDDGPPRTYITNWKLVPPHAKEKDCLHIDFEWRVETNALRTIGCASDQHCIFSTNMTVNTFVATNYYFWQQPAPPPPPPTEGTETVTLYSNLLMTVNYKGVMLVDAWVESIPFTNYVRRWKLERVYQGEAK
jgi:hypothetical protein